MRVRFAMLAVAAVALATAGCGGGSSAPSGPFEVSLALSSQSPDGTSLTIAGSSDRNMTCGWKLNGPPEAQSKTLDTCEVEIDTFGAIGRYDVTVTALDDAGGTSTADCRFSYPNPMVYCMSH